MLSPGKFRPGWLVIPFFCLVLAVGMWAPNARAGPSAQYIPSINAVVEGLVFYESARRGPPPKDRVYRSEFIRSQARFINWELRLKHPNPGRRINFRIQARYYSPTGKLLAEQGLDTYFGSNWNTSRHNFSYGSDRPGTWALGTYRVDIFIGKTKAASGSFRVISGKGQTITPPKPPKPKIDLPPDLEGL